MSQLSAEQVRDMELRKWRFPQNLAGVVLDDFDSLRQQLPVDSELGEVYFKKVEIGLDGGTGYDLYARTFLQNEKISFYAAYGCHSCKKVIVGNPMVDIFSGEELWEREMVFSCRNCNACLDKR